MIRNIPLPFLPLTVKCKIFKFLKWLVQNTVLKYSITTKIVLLVLYIFPVRKKF